MFRRTAVVAAFTLACAAAFAQSFTDSHAVPGASSSSVDTAAAIVAVPSSRDISRRCEEHEATRDECKLHWRGALLQTGRFLAAQDAGLIAFDKWSRYETFHGNWFSKYSDALHAPRFGHWNDGDPFLVNYVGHPMQGAVVEFSYIENDPKGVTLTIAKSKTYWFSRLRAMAWAAAYEAQWELGPIGEAGIGFEGRTTYYSKASHGYTDGAGLTDLIATPLGGTIWVVGEDALDKVLIRRLEAKTHNPLLRLVIAGLNPNRSVSNLMRLKMPWYRDNRPTGMTGFWANR